MTTASSKQSTNSHAGGGSSPVQNVKRDGDTATLTASGEIDLHNSPELRGELLKLLGDGEIKNVVVNLAAVPYMDSSAVAVLVEALQKLRKHGGKVCLSNLQPRVKGLLEIARLDQIFVLCDNEADAKNKPDQSQTPPVEGNTAA